MTISGFDCLKVGIMEIRKSLLSRTISFLRFPMIFFILYLHVVLGAWSNGRIVSDTTFVGYELVRFIFVEGFSRIFVPCFFLISGFLFFYYSGFDRHIYWEKMKKRFRSLLVPYLFWNCFVIFLYFLGETFVPSLMSGQNKHIADFTSWDWLMCFWRIDGWAPINFPLWFLRDLIILSLFSPLVYVAVRWGRLLSVLLVGVLWFCFGTPSNCFVGLFFFTAGAWLGINKVDPVEQLLPWRKAFLLTYLCVMSVGVLLRWNGIAEGVYLQKVGILLGLCSVFSWAARFLENRNPDCKLLENSSFFVYAYHGLPLLFLSKFSVYCLHPDSSWELVILFFVLPVFVSAIGVAAYWLLNRYFPRFNRWISGR